MVAGRLNLTQCGPLLGNSSIVLYVLVIVLFVAIMHKLLLSCVNCNKEYWSKIFVKVHLQGEHIWAKSPFLKELRLSLGNHTPSKHVVQKKTTKVFFSSIFDHYGGGGTT